MFCWLLRLYLDVGIVGSVEDVKGCVDDVLGGLPRFLRTHWSRAAEPVSSEFSCSALTTSSIFWFIGWEIEDILCKAVDIAC